jgi:DNA-binding MarR family transcriptional regulator
MRLFGAVMNNSSVYLRFLNLTQAVNSKWVDTEIDLLAIRLLEAISVAHAGNVPMTVSQAMGLSAIASPATIHRKLDQLREAGLIEQTFEGKNRRTKYLVPTASAATHFEELGKAMLLASQHS